MKLKMTGLNTPANSTLGNQRCATCTCMKTIDSLPKKKINNPLAVSDRLLKSC